MSIKNNAAVQIRNFPYPFKAGLSVCSDIDECDIEDFIKIHRFLNSKKYGIGIPVADSFFGATKDLSQLSYFDLNGTKRLKESEFIRQAIADGLIDSLHSWGDFNEKPPSRELIKIISEKLTNDICTYKLNIPIWINHGSPNNWQNLYSRKHSEYQGDDMSSPLYTGQLIKKLGIKYYWDSELVEWPLSAQKLARNRTFERIYLNKIKNIIKTILNRKELIRSSDRIIELTNKIVLRDKTHLIAFNRFAKHPDKNKRWMADRESLRYSISKESLEKLIEVEGYYIVYTHLGKPSFKKYGRIFQEEDEEALFNLSNLYRKKAIWITTTSSLLKFKTINENIKWNAFDNTNNIIINIEGINDPVDGLYIPTAEDLSGICFYSSILDKTLVQIDGKEVSAHIFSKDEKKGGGWIGFNISDEPKTQLIE